MKCTLLLFAFVLSAALAAGQNLVPNPSFEEYIDCPFSTAELNNQVIGWYSWQETPDFYHACSNDIGGYAGVPNNAFGFQNAILGEAYAGLGTYAHTFPNIREYMAVQLIEPMIVGQDYYIVFHASLWSGEGDSHLWCATNHIGLRFFLNPEYDYQTNPLVPDNFAHLDYAEILSDTTNWTKISGWVHADQPYNWLAIGNFFTDENTEIEELNPNNSCVGLYFIENVCVGSSEEDCLYMLNTDNLSLENGYKLYPNPASRFITIAGLKQTGDKAEIIDLHGRTVLTTSFSNITDNRVDISAISPGIYILRIHSDNHFSNHKILKQ